MDKFDEAYKNLNKAQKEAVDTIDGPVMVVAGPGTGKTQILTLRIANILKSEVGVEASSILCLTFTRSGVNAMKKRLESYIGSASRNVKITTFHSFAIEIVEKNFSLLDFHALPKLIDDTDSVAIVDELLQNGDFEYIRPRTDPAKYFNDLKSLISLLKREGVKPEQFLIEVEKEINDLENNEDNISTRGESKGSLKKEIIKKIESLNRSREVVTFYEEYEKLKRERSMMDYDDVLAYAVKLVEEYEDVRADVLENYQYVLVDEHQDSSGIQNAFLKAVWRGVTRPDIFVVGDDRQLIYGFSGANIDYFTEFKNLFGEAKMITLTENYRSTAPILSLADELLKSDLTNEKLNSNIGGKDEVALFEYHYNRDEIIGAGIYFKNLINNSVKANECAILVPKNRHVRSATNMLRMMGLPVVSEQSMSLLDMTETQSLMQVLGIISDPYNSVLLANALLDKYSLVPTLIAHKFLKDTKKTDKITIEDFIKEGGNDNLFAGDNPIKVFGLRLKFWIDTLAHESVSHIVSVIGNELLIDHAQNHEELLKSIEIVRSFIHASVLWEEKNKTGSLSDFIKYFERFTSYGNHVELAHLGKSDGVHVMTLHKSKGLEYEHVWIAHMNEEILMSEKHTAFTLPESIKEKIAKRNIETAKRELYVAITRAKRFCTISYANKRDDGVDMTLANIIADLPDGHFIKKSADENENVIIALDPKYYAPKYSLDSNVEIVEEIKEFVVDRFAEIKISVSMLNNFFECSRKWYFRNFLKLPEVKGVSLALGSAVHSTIEYILKQEKLPDTQTIKENIIYFLQKEGVHDKSDIARLGKDAYTAVKNWIDVYYKNLAEERMSERSVSYRDPRFPNLSMYGKIDLTERLPDGSIVVTDFKTGTSKTAGVIEKLDDEDRLSSYMRQLAMYSHLINGVEDENVAKSRLLFLEEDSKNKNSLYSTHVTSEQIDLLVRDISDYEKMLTDGSWVTRPCNAKSYGGNNECEYCKRMENIIEEK
jgi:DNA helicase-2/ATP-dependent DNA helicase PcrA